jgi:dihydroorotase-like cyclic amidohydrolase
MTTTRLPGLIDIHVHLRDPGGTQKEDFSSGTAAALAGGFVAVLDMPNNTPPVVDPSTLTRKIDIASRKAQCDYAFYAGASTGNAAEPLTDPHVVGLKMYLNETYGPLHVASLPLLMEHFRSWPRHKPIAAHAEGISTAVVIGLAQLYDRSAHICHVSRRSQIELVRKAKEQGVRITCEVTPHHLFLDEDDVPSLGGLAYMKPELGTREDRQALWDNLEIVDAVASDHAPHTLEEKKGDSPPPGVPGLETTLPLLLNAVHEGRLTLERLVELLHDGPARVMHVRPPDESYTEVDLQDRWVIKGADLQTRCGWTPFEGLAVRGRVQAVYLRGGRAYGPEGVLAAPGSGRPLLLT